MQQMVNEPQAPASDIEKDDLQLMNQLVQIGVQDQFAILLPSDRRQQITKHFPEWVIVGASHDFPNFQFDDTDLYDQAPEIVDAIIRDANDLLQEGKPAVALSHLNEGIRRLCKSLFNHNLTLDSIYERTEKIRNTVSGIAHKLGSNEFTIEFTISFPPGMTIGLHFKSELGAIEGR